MDFGFDVLRNVLNSVGLLEIFLCALPVAKGDVNFAEVHEDFGIWLVTLFQGSELNLQRILEITAAIVDPRQAGEIGRIIIIHIQGASDKLLSLLEVFIAIGPHVAEVI